MRRFLPIILALFVFWQYEENCQDRLEIKTDLNKGPWIKVQGPYSIRNGQYVVEIPNQTVAGSPRFFFRVVREWGDPWTPLGDWPDLKKAEPIP